MKRIVCLTLLAVFLLAGCVTQEDVDAAYNKGYKAGYSDGEYEHAGDYKAGFTDGMNRAMEYVNKNSSAGSVNSDRPVVSHSDSYEEGYEAGYERGYDEGYYEARQEYDIDP